MVMECVGGAIMRLGGWNGFLVMEDAATNQRDFC